MNDNDMNEARALTPRRVVTEAARMMRVLDEMDYPLVLVAHDGALRYANQFGLHELTTGGALQLTHGLVRSRLAGEQGALQAAVADAVRGKRRMMTLCHDAGTVPLAVVPVPGEEPGEETLVLLLFGRRPATETLTLDFYARGHGLTGAETQVLKGLCAGLQPKEIARRGNVAISTVRSHICSIRLKTQTASIRELINRVASLPPITPAMKRRPVPSPVAFEPTPAERSLLQALTAC